MKRILRFLIAFGWFAILLGNGVAPAVPHAMANSVASSLYLPLVTSPPSSEQVIDAAVERGELDVETALLYKVYALFGDPRLPVAFRGVDQRKFESDLMERVLQVWDTLAPATRDALQPFFTPPVYPGSWGDPARYATRATERVPAVAATQPGACPSGVGELLPGWARLETENLYIWYPLDGDGDNASPQQVAAAANQIADAMAVVWPQESQLLGRTPLPDEGLPCNGGDGKFDIYLKRVNIRTAALTIGYPPGCESRPAFMAIAPDYITSSEAAEYVIAHEFMHALQFVDDRASACHDYTWLDEATANWAVDYVYPSNNSEQRFASLYFHPESFDFPIQAGDWGRIYGNANGYEDYIFFFYLTHQLNNPGLIRAIQDRTRSLSSVDAVDQVIPGGFDGQWPGFLRANINRSGVDEYARWDGLEAGYSKNARPGSDQAAFEVTLGDSTERIHDMGARYVLPLSSQYSWYTFPEEEVRTIEFIDYHFKPGEDENGTVQAWLRLANGNTRVEDWTGRSHITFCRDKESENVVEVMIVYGNSTVVTDPLDYGRGYNTASRKLRVSQQGCACEVWMAVPAWEGGIRFGYTQSGTQATEESTETATVDRDTSVTFRASVQESGASSMSWRISLMQGAASIRDQYTIEYSDEERIVMNITGQGGPEQPPTLSKGYVRVAAQPDGACKLTLELYIYVMAQNEMLGGMPLPSLVGHALVIDHTLPERIGSVGGNPQVPVRVSDSTYESKIYLQSGGTYPEGFGSELSRFLGESSLGTTELTWSVSPAAARGK